MYVDEWVFRVLIALVAVSSPLRGQDVVELPLPTAPTAAELTEDGLYLIVAHEQGNLITIWDVKGEKVVASVKTEAPRHILCRGDSVFVANCGKGTISVLSAKQGFKVTDQLLVDEKNVFFLSALPGKAFDGRILASCGNNWWAGRAFVVDSVKDTCRPVPPPSPRKMPAATVSGAGGTVAETGGVFSVDDYFAEAKTPLTSSVGGFLLAAVPGTLLWIGPEGIHWGYAVDKLAPGQFAADATVPLIYELQFDDKRKTPVLLARALDETIEPLASQDLSDDALHRVRSVPPRMLAATHGGTLYLFLRRSNTGNRGAVMLSVKAKSFAALPATRPASDRLVLAPTDFIMTPGLDGDVLLLQGNSLIVFRQDLGDKRSMVLSTIYKRIAERKDYYVALSVDSVDLLDKRTGAVLKRIPLPTKYPNDMTCHLLRSVTYVSVTMQVTRQPSRTKEYVSVLAVVNEQSGKVDVSSACPALRLFADPKGVYLASLVGDPQESWINPPAPRVPSHGAAIVYDIRQDPPVRKSPIPLADRSTLRRIAWSPDGKTFCYTGEWGLRASETGDIPAVALFEPTDLTKPVLAVNLRKALVWTRATIVTLHPSGKLAAVYDGKRTVLVALPGGDAVELPAGALSDESQEVRDLQFTPDGTRLLVVARAKPPGMEIRSIMVPDPAAGGGRAMTGPAAGESLPQESER